MYHDVVKERGRDSVWFDTTVEEFQGHIDEILKDGYTVISLDQLYKHLTDGEPVPPKSVCLTFDDNYQGVYDNVMPILREHRMQAAVFVHTGFVGSTTGHPKMTWDELKELQKEGLITVGAHTVTHPENFKDLPMETQRKEVVDSKKELEDHLGVEIPYMAYPIGSNDSITQMVTRDAGYKMSFTMEPTTAEASPNILAVGRYEAKKFAKAIEDQNKEIDLAAVGIADLPLVKRPVTSVADKYADIRMVLLKGGTPVSILADGRKTVGEFITENNGIAGINGSFFVMAEVASTDNRLIGPSRPSNRTFTADDDAYRLTKLIDRPMVIWGPTRIAFVPFQPGSMNAEEPYKQFMPDYTDAFLGGAWIVHDGIAKTREQMAPYASQDIMDFRKRAFFGVTKEGEVICGASRGSITTEDLARAAAAAGAQEAVLLDSGFSSSVIFDNQILVTGHSNIDHPSRPVPHAIVLQGEKGETNWGDLETIPVTKEAIDAAHEDRPQGETRRRRRRR
jgi:peptidoglycan/xylan/chitin deacetylase (PgdA/CDA1 family)